MTTDFASLGFTDNEVQTELRALARKFAENEIRPIVDRDEETETFRPEIIRKLGQVGLTGVPVPEAYGGAGLGYAEYLVVIEELARVSASYAVSVSVTGLAQMILASGGTEDQKAKYLPKLASGEMIGGFALSEASSGSDAASLRLTARFVAGSAGQDGDHYVLNGTKLWITQADSAGVLIVMARTGGPGASGVTAFAVETNSPGFRCSKREKKMGLSISHTMEIVLENVRVPAENRIGPEGEGFKVAMNALNGGRLTISAVAVGVGRGALEVAVAHAKEREQFGKKIAEFQGVSFLLADMRATLDASELLLRRAAALRDAGLPFATEASISKLFTTDATMKVTTDAVQILGGSGYTKEFPAERYMREAKILQIFEGTNQIQRMIIGRALTK
ncbi:MAG: acyl-CoA dehydrogenase family protein [Bdellovibrionales bacterium]|nr:acyl-CoA dehydrogenase family protein [Bdellovibrionales bacterium]